MAVAISALDLYEKSYQQAMKDNIAAENIPSFSWFKFQFWPKDSTTKTAMNYTGCLKVKYLMQQRMIKKQHEDDHYCAAILKHAREFAVLINVLMINIRLPLESRICITKG